jgi:hypothetical protein
VPRSYSSTTSPRSVRSGFSASRASNHSRSESSISRFQPPILPAAALPVSRQRCDHFTTLATLTLIETIRSRLGA